MYTLRNRLLGDLFETDEFRAPELEHDLVQRRAARELHLRRHQVEVEMPELSLHVALDAVLALDAATNDSSYMPAYERAKPSRHPPMYDAKRSSKVLPGPLFTFEKSSASTW